MLDFAANGPDCERAGALASLALDGELSEVDEARLGAHLRTCRECERRADEIRALTGALRTAPLEEPARRVELPARTARAARVRHLVARGALAATLAAAAASLGVLAGSVGREPARQAPAGPEIALLDERHELREIRRFKSPAPLEREAPRVGGV
jgi:anti-sigma factor RsiW